MFSSRMLIPLEGHLRYHKAAVTPQIYQGRPISCPLVRGTVAHKKDLLHTYWQVKIKWDVFSRIYF